MNVRNVKINVFSNSDQLLEFLKTKRIYNYTYNFEPLQKGEENEENNIDKEDQEDFKGTVQNEINVLAVDTDLLLIEDDSIFEKSEGKSFREMAKLFEESGSWKWLYESKLKDKYEFVFLYGKHQPIYNKDFDIHFKNFDIFKDFLKFSTTSLMEWITVQLNKRYNVFLWNKALRIEMLNFQ